MIKKKAPGRPKKVATLKERILKDYGERGYKTLLGESFGKIDEFNEEQYEELLALMRKEKGVMWHRR